jgi:hypothetical protein
MTVEIVMFPAESMALDVSAGQKKATMLANIMTTTLQATGEMDAVKDSLTALKETIDPLIAMLDSVQKLHPFIGGELLFIELYHYKFNEQFFWCLVAVLAFKVFQFFFHCCFSLVDFSFLSYRAYGALK